jgi:hypothetical protein
MGFVTDNHCANVGQLVKMGFVFDPEPSPFMTNGHMSKRGTTYRACVLALDDIMIISDSKSDLDTNSPTFMSDSCMTWDEVLDSLVKRKAITAKQRAKYPDMSKES